MPYMPVPDDWDEETWECYSIQWPKSVDYRAILLGQITELTRGRFWDASTGTVTDAQAIAYEILARNLNLEECLLACNDEVLSILNNLTIAIASNNSVVSGCCVGGTVFPTSPGVEGDTPPDGFVATTDVVGSAAYNTRKCKLANIGHEQIKEIIDEFVAAGLDTMANLLGAAALPAITSIVGAIIGEISTPFPLLDALIGGLIGAIAGIAIQLIEDGIDLEQLAIDLAANDEDFVCALYESTGAAGAITSYLDVADTVGVSTANQAVLAAILLVDWLNALFFDPEQYQQSLASAIADYEAPTPCTNCAPIAPNYIICTFGSMSPSNQEPNATGTYYDITPASASSPSRLICQFFLNVQSGAFDCTKNPQAVTQIETLTGTIVKVTGFYKYEVTDCGATVVYESDTTPGASNPGQRFSVVGDGGTAYTIRVHLGDVVEG